MPKARQTKRQKHDELIQQLRWLYIGVSHDTCWLLEPDVREGIGMDAESLSWIASVVCNLLDLPSGHALRMACFVDYYSSPEKLAARLAADWIHSLDDPRAEVPSC